MSPLATQQQALLGALLAPPRGPQARTTTAHFAPWARGLAAYQANGHALAERCLRAAYPVVAALVGDESFAALARDFWHHHPPVRGDLAHWGDALAGFVANARQLADVPYLADVARVEWALHRAAGAPDGIADPASLALLASADPDRLGLCLPPDTTVLTSDWPVASLVTAHLYGEPPMDTVAQRVQAHRGENTTVWRQGLRPRIAACTHAAAALLQTVIAGGSVLAGLQAALAADAGFDLGAWLQAAVQDGLVLGAVPLQALSPDAVAPQPG